MSQPSRKKHRPGCRGRLELSPRSGFGLGTDGPVSRLQRAERCCAEPSACGRASRPRRVVCAGAVFFVGLVVAEGCEGSGHRDAGDTAMTSVSLWDWAKLCCTPKLLGSLVGGQHRGWLAGWLAGREAQRTAQAGSHLATLHVLVPVPVPVPPLLMAGSGPTMHAKSSRRGGSGIAG